MSKQFNTSLALQVTRNNPFAYGGTIHQLTSENPLIDTTNLIWNKAIDKQAYFMAKNQIVTWYRFYTKDCNNDHTQACLKLIKGFYYPINSFEYWNSDQATSYLLGYVEELDSLYNWQLSAL